jgi:hypothetical protein
VFRSIAVVEQRQLAVMTLTVARSPDTAFLSSTPQAISRSPVPWTTQMSVALSTIGGERREYRRVD